MLIRVYDTGDFFERNFLEVKESWVLPIFILSVRILRREDTEGIGFDVEKRKNEMAVSPHSFHRRIFFLVRARTSPCFRLDERARVSDPFIAL